MEVEKPPVPGHLPPFRRMQVLHACGAHAYVQQNSPRINNIFSAPGMKSQLLHRFSRLPCLQTLASSSRATEVLLQSFFLFPRPFHMLFHLPGILSSNSSSCLHFFQTWLKHHIFTSGLPAGCPKHLSFFHKPFHKNYIHVGTLSSSSFSPFPQHSPHWGRFSIHANCTDTGVPLPSSNFPRPRLQVHAASRRARRCRW